MPIELIQDSGLNEDFIEKHLQCLRFHVFFFPDVLNQLRSLQKFSVKIQHGVSKMVDILKLGVS